VDISFDVDGIDVVFFCHDVINVDISDIPLHDQRRDVRRLLIFPTFRVDVVVVHFAITGRRSFGYKDNNHTKSCRNRSAKMF